MLNAKASEISKKRFIPSRTHSQEEETDTHKNYNKIKNVNKRKSYLILP